MPRTARAAEAPPSALVKISVTVVALVAIWLWTSLVLAPYQFARGLVDGGRQLAAAENKLSKGDVSKALQLALSASSSTEQASAEFDAPSPLLDVVRAIPMVRDALGETGHIVRAMELSAESALGALSVAQDALSGGLITRDPDNPDRSVIDLDRLDKAAATINDVHASARAVVDELKKIDLAKLPARVRPRVKNAIADAREAIERVDVARRGFALLPGILGAEGRRNYLLGFQNPAEQRGTGGAILQFKVLKFDRGAFELTDIAGGEHTGSVYNIDKDRQTYDIPLPPDAWLVGQIEDAQRFGNANWSPDWPLSAHLMLDYAYTSARVNDDLEVPRFDGFIIVDPLAVEKLMPGVGSFTTKRSGDKITPRNVVHFVLYEAYGKYPNQVQRRRALAQIVNEFFSRALSSRKLEAVMGGVGDSLSEKHIQLWMQDRDVQKFVKEMKWDGSIKRAKGSDYVYVVEQNVGGNKLDFFSSQSNSIDVSFDGQDALVSTEMRVHNGIFGPQPNWVVGDVGPLHRPMMNLYVPGTAELISSAVEGTRLDSPAPAIWNGTRPPEDFESGKKVWTATLEIPAGEDGAIRYDYRVPGVVRRRDGRYVYRLIVQSQPKVNPEHLTVTVALPAGATDVEVTGWRRDGNTLVWDKPIRRDLEFEVSWAAQ